MANKEPLLPVSAKSSLSSDPEPSGAAELLLAEAVPEVALALDDALGFVLALLVSEAVALALDVTEADGEALLDGVGVLDADGVLLGVGEAVGLGEAVGVPVAVGVGVAITSPSARTVIVTVAGSENADPSLAR